MKFFHIINTKRGSGITVATEIIEESTGAGFLVECATSFCAPCETNFSRPKGRMIAMSRLSSGKEMPAFKRFTFRTDNRQSLKAQALLCLRGNMPEDSLDWARSLVNRELSRLETLREIDAIRRGDA